MRKLIANWIDHLIICVLVLASGGATASPDDIISTQKVELIERLAGNSYMQHTVQIRAVIDGFATVCFRTPPATLALCFYKMYAGNEAVMVPTKIMSGEVKT